MVDVGNGRKVEILEADLEDYPGMYLNLNETQKGLKAVYAPYPTQRIFAWYQLHSHQIEQIILLKQMAQEIFHGVLLQ